MLLKAWKGNNLPSLLFIPFEITVAEVETVDGKIVRPRTTLFLIDSFFWEKV